MIFTSDERREVARKLRKCTPPTSYGQSQGGGWAHLCDMALVVGFKREDNPTAWELAQRLADLIEPPTQCPYYHSDRHYCSVYEDLQVIDRDALLELADEMDADGMDGWTHAVNVGDYARRIRKALGEES